MSRAGDARRESEWQRMVAASGFVTAEYWGSVAQDRAASARSSPRLRTWLLLLVLVLSLAPHRLAAAPQELPPPPAEPPVGAEPNNRVVRPNRVLNGRPVPPRPVNEQPGNERQQNGLPAGEDRVFEDQIRPQLNGPPQWRIESEAYFGEPFGVGRITLRWLGNAEPSALWEQLAKGEGFLVRESDRRVHYPVLVEQQAPLGANLPPVDAAGPNADVPPRGDRGLGLGRGRLRGERRLRGRGLQILAQLIAGRPRELSCYFLFTGRAPLRVNLQVPESIDVDLVPESRPHAQQRLLTEWWQRYTEDYTQARRDGSYPAVAETYLCGMLASRLDLPSPFTDTRPASAQTPKQVLELLAGTENLRLTRLAETWLAPAHEAASVDLPQSLTWPTYSAVVDEATAADDLLAAHVPDDCFYVRFGRFNNYLWLKEFLLQQGGDVARLVTLRGHERSHDAAIQQQLGLQETALSRWLGETAIDDMAILGADFYVQEGAALGVMFQARQSQILRSQLLQQRKKRWEELGADERRQETIKYQDVEIDYLGSENHALRSFYVQIDNIHLVTNCLQLARDVIDAHAGRNRLVDDMDYQRAHAREAGRSDLLAFVFLPRHFFARLLSPQYQVEVSRRVDTATQLQMLQMAEWAARAERLGVDSVPGWVQRGLLPRHFLNSSETGDADTRWLRVAGRWQHALRGAHGSFLPVPDVSIEQVTASEAARYEALREYAEQHWQRLDPVAIRVARRPSLEAGQNRADILVIEAHLNPFDPQKYGTATSILGPPTTRWIGTSSQDIISVQAHMQGGYLSPAVGPHHLFLGVEDLEPRKVTAERPLFRWLQIIRSTPGYIGAWPKSGLLDMIPLGFRQTANELGLVRLPLGLWRWQTPDGFAVLSFFPDILEAIVPELTVVEDEPELTAQRYGDAQPAQLRIYIGDLASSRFGAWVDGLSYERASESSWANIRLMHLLVQQFGLPLRDARMAAEELLGARLICPLGGELEIVDIATPHAAQRADREPAAANRTNANRTNANRADSERTLDDQLGRAELEQLEPLTSTSRWISTALAAGDEQQDSFRSPLMAWFRGLRGHLTMAEGELVASLVLHINHETSAAGLKLPQLPGIPSWLPSGRKSEGAADASRALPPSAAGQSTQGDNEPPAIPIEELPVPPSAEGD